MNSDDELTKRWMKQWIDMVKATPEELEIKRKQYFQVFNNSEPVLMLKEKIKEKYPGLGEITITNVTLGDIGGKKIVEDSININIDIEYNIK